MTDDGRNVSLFELTLDGPRLEWRLVSSSSKYSQQQVTAVTGDGIGSGPWSEEWFHFVVSSLHLGSVRVCERKTVP
ncbi:hypothetical protein RRG08_029631 [Elysia crispata]|uniref:Uncharacterized protein n=1 Tax=Elysia crispata TaxID=231223 RepID=A0AAE0XPD2_9GAST|nr:hypothetical protein RRG08_029631 [Elysia crispata]